MARKSQIAFQLNPDLRGHEGCAASMPPLGPPDYVPHSLS